MRERVFWEEETSTRAMRRDRTGEHTEGAVPEQRKPGSRAQEESQPSELEELASSHCSLASRKPFPQRTHSPSGVFSRHSHE